MPGIFARTSSGMFFVASPMTSMFRKTASMTSSCSTNCSWLIPEVNRRIFPQQAMMSSIRRLGSRGKDGLLVDLRLHFWAQAFRREQVHPLAEQVFEVQLQAHEIVEGCLALER